MNWHAQGIRKTTDVIKSSGTMNIARQERVTGPRPKGGKEPQESVWLQLSQLQGGVSLKLSGL